MAEKQEHQILFSTSMIQAILERRKTQTRRVIKPQPFDPDYVKCINDKGTWVFKSQSEITFWIYGKCPYGQVGDRLWVRETWASQHKFDHLPPRLIPHDANIHYAASENLGGLMHRPSIFLPRWASRLTLEITDIRVQRLQEISEDDCESEGILFTYLKGNPCRVGCNHNAYHELWDSINGKTHPWESNPWVWAISFKLLGGQSDRRTLQ